MTDLELTNRDVDQSHAEEILRTIPLPSEISNVEIRLGAGSTGDPAMWVIIWVDPTLQFVQKKADLLNRFAEEVQSKMLQGNFTHFPYVTLDQAA